jgi:hypothetical protein
MSDLNIYASRLLKFVLESVDDGLRASSGALEYFREADHAIGILHKILSKEDDGPRLVELTFRDVFNTSFARILEMRNPKEREQALKDALDNIEVAKTLFK